MTDPKPKRRWYQFRLRTLLVFVLLVSVALSWFAVKLNQARKQRKAVEAIQKVGGSVIYDYEITADGTDISGATAPSAPAWIRKLLGDDLFRSVVWVVSSGPAFGDAELEHVEGLPKLEGLRLVSVCVTDGGLEHLKGLPNLKHFTILDTPVTDAGLKYLKGLTELETLDFHRTQVTNEGVKKLQEALPNCDIRH